MNKIIKFIPVIIAIILPGISYPIVRFAGYCNLNCTPDADPIVRIVGFILLVVIFALSFMLLWKKSNSLQKRRKKAVKTVIILVLGILFILVAVIFQFAATFSFVRTTFTKVEFGSPPETYYIEEFQPMKSVKGDLAYTLHKKQNILFMENIGGSGKIHTKDSYGYFDPSSEDAVVRFSKPGDYMFETTVFYYKPAKKELYLPED